MADISWPVIGMNVRAMWLSSCSTITHIVGNYKLSNDLLWVCLDKIGVADSSSWNA